jgi:hypothetical protein
MKPQAVRFGSSYNGYDPSTIFRVDPTNKTLSPFGSGEAFTGAGFQFGQEQLVQDPNQFAGFAMGSPIQSQAQGLSQVTDQLNQFQQGMFGESQAPKRASATLEERIATADAGVDIGMTEFQKLRQRMEALKTPNYAQQFTDLRTQQGVPGLEKDYMGVRQNLRELPYTQRAQTGNAGVATEGQLQAQTAQNAIPLEIQEANLIDRLKLAADFVNNSMQMQELDYNTSRQALGDAINLVGETINMSRTQLSDLFGRQDRERQRADQALQFRLENNVTSPFFNSGGTVYDSGSLEPIKDENTFQQRYGMTLQDAEARGLVGKLDSGVIQERSLVLDLAASYPDAGIFAGDTLAEAQSKLRNSRIYREQVRPPQYAGSSGVVSTTLLNQIAGSPEAKKLTALQDLQSKLYMYRDIVSETGFAAGGVDKARLDSIYADLKIAYKEAANLGALTGPDIAVLEEAIKPASGVKNLGGYIVSGGGAGVLASIDQGLATVQKQYTQNSTALTTRYPQAANDPYFVNLTSGGTEAAIEREAAALQAQGVLSPSTPQQKQEGFFGKVLNFFGF